MSDRSLTERAMGMSEAVWMRHANPWSGWTRMTIPPLFALAIWSRDWIGWGAVGAVVLVCVWTWLNPRLFRAPAHLGAWMSQGVLGERIWLDQRRNRGGTAPHHARVPILLAWVSGLGVLPFAWGLWQLQLWPVLTGLILILGGKLWFIDRMVWIATEGGPEAAARFAPGLPLNPPGGQA